MGKVFLPIWYKCTTSFNVFSYWGKDQYTSLFFTQNEYATTVKHSFIQYIKARYKNFTVSSFLFLFYNTVKAEGRNKQRKA